MSGPVNFQTFPTDLEFSLCGNSPGSHNCVCSYIILFLSGLEDKTGQIYTLPHFPACPVPFYFPSPHDSPRKEVVGRGGVLSREQTSCLPVPPHTCRQHSCSQRFGAVSPHLGRWVSVIM